MSDGMMDEKEFFRIAPVSLRLDHVRVAARIVVVSGKQAERFAAGKREHRVVLESVRPYGAKPPGQIMENVPARDCFLPKCIPRRYGNLPP